MLIKSYTHQIASRKEFEMTKITQQVRQDVADSGVTNGLVFVITMHTTTGIMINESLPCVERDIETALERLVPNDGDYAHAYAPELWHMQRQRAGSSQVHAEQKSLRPSHCRRQNGRRQRAGHLFR